MACIISGVFYPEREYKTNIKSYPVYKSKSAYAAWVSMLHRVYYSSQLKKGPSYSDISVCNEWFHYSNFENWFLSQNYETDLDKDLKYPVHNKLYSPDTCLLIPKSVNGFLVGLFDVGTLMKGVQHYKHRKGTKVWKAQISRDSGKGAKHLGWFYTEEDAHLAWKYAKLKKCEELYNAVNSSLKPHVLNLYSVIENFNFKGENNV